VRFFLQVLAKSGKVSDYASKQTCVDEEELVDPKDAGKIRDRQESRYGASICAYLRVRHLHPWFCFAHIFFLMPSPFSFFACRMMQVIRKIEADPLRIGYRALDNTSPVASSSDGGGEDGEGDDDDGDDDDDDDDDDDEAEEDDAQDVDIRPTAPSGNDDGVIPPVAAPGAAARAGTDKQLGGSKRGSNGTPKKKFKSGVYDYEDDFIDDTEVEYNAMQALGLNKAIHDGFCVIEGEVETDQRMEDAVRQNQRKQAAQKRKLAGGGAEPNEGVHPFTAGGGFASAAVLAGVGGVDHGGEGGTTLGAPRSIPSTPEKILGSTVPEALRVPHTERMSDLLKDLGQSLANAAGDSDHGGGGGGGGRPASVERMFPALRRLARSASSPCWGSPELLPYLNKCIEMVSASGLMPQGQILGFLQSEARSYVNELSRAWGDVVTAVDAVADKMAGAALQDDFCRDLIPYDVADAILPLADKIREAAGGGLRLAKICEEVVHLYTQRGFTMIKLEDIRKAYQRAKGREKSKQRTEDKHHQPQPQGDNVAAEPTVASQVGVGGAWPASDSRGAPVAAYPGKGGSATNYAVDMRSLMHLDPNAFARDKQEAEKKGGARWAAFQVLETAGRDGRSPSDLYNEIKKREMLWGELPTDVAERETAEKKFKSQLGSVLNASRPFAKVARGTYALQAFFNGTELEIIAKKMEDERKERTASRQHKHEAGGGMMTPPAHHADSNTVGW